MNLTKPFVYDNLVVTFKSYFAPCADYSVYNRDTGDAKRVSIDTEIGWFRYTELLTFEERCAVMGMRDREESEFREWLELRPDLKMYAEIFVKKT